MNKYNHNLIGCQILNHIVNLELIISNCESINLNWLFYGEGPIWKVDLQEAKEIDQYEFTQVPYYPEVYASAGSGLIPEDHEPLYLSFRTCFIKNTLGSQTKDLLVLSIKGDSMEPVIMNGDDALIDQARTNPRFGPPYLIRLDDVLHCKIIHPISPERWLIMSKNETYQPFEINPTKDPIKIIGEIVWWARKSQYL